MAATSPNPDEEELVFKPLADKQRVKRKREITDEEDKVMVPLPVEDRLEYIKCLVFTLKNYRDKAPKR